MSKTVLGFFGLVVVLAAAGLGLGCDGSLRRPRRRPRATWSRPRTSTATSLPRSAGRTWPSPRSCTTRTPTRTSSPPAPATRLAVRRAAVVIQNGVGYDSFIQKLEAAAPSSHRIVVTMADVLGVHGADANPHLWYDVPRLGRIAGAIAAALERADPAPPRRLPRGPAPLRAQPARRSSARWRRSARRRGRPGRLHRAGAGLPARGRRPAQPHPAGVRAGDRGRQRAVARGGRADDRPAHRPPRARAALQRPGRLADHRAGSAPPPARRASPWSASRETLPPGETFQAWQLRQARALERALDR